MGNGFPFKIKCNSCPSLIFNMSWWGLPIARLCHAIYVLSLYLHFRRKYPARPTLYRA